LTTDALKYLGALRLSAGLLQRIGILSFH